LGRRSRGNRFHSLVLAKAVTTKSGGQLTNRTQQPSADVSGLPDYTFGPTAVGWWGVVGFMLIEGMAFLLGIGAYFYLIPNEPEWPPAAQPDLFWGTSFLLVAIGSEVFNARIKRRAKHRDLRGVRIGLVMILLISLVLIALRAMEFSALNVRWDQNAYGSIVWALVVLHTLHLVTDTYDTGVAAALAYSKEMTGRRFSEIDDNALYWHFIVWSWVVLYLVVYWTPRWI
jgi:cytochrome c oxidase subunit III